MTKKLIPIFKAEIKNGILIHKNAVKFQSYLNSLNGEVEVVVRKHNKKRSHNQNNLYWAYLNIIEQETGDSANDLHEYFKRTHLTPKFITACKHTIKIPRSTTELSAGEFGEYMEKICRETNIPIPDRNLEIELEMENL
jgi:hypothetical protein